jgi:hypothetical protein
MGMRMKLYVLLVITVVLMLRRAVFYDGNFPIFTVPALLSSIIFPTINISLSEGELPKKGVPSFVNPLEEGGL